MVRAVKTPVGKGSPGMALKVFADGGGGRSFFVAGKLGRPKIVHQGLNVGLKNDKNKKLSIYERSIVFSDFRCVQSSEEVIVTAVVYFSQFNDDADADIQFSCFVFSICGTTDVASTAL